MVIDMRHRRLVQSVTMAKIGGKAVSGADRIVAPGRGGDFLEAFGGGFFDLTN